MFTAASGAAGTLQGMLQGRLGVNIHRDHWPTAATLKAAEAAGFAWVQVHTPPRAMLADREHLRRHARALRAALGPTGLRLLLHGPDDLKAGTLEDDRAFEGLLDHACECGAEIVVYHGINHLDVDGPAAERIAERVAAERRALRRLAARADALGVMIAVENLAPVYPGPARLCHDPLRVRDFVREIGSPRVGMLLDLGHAHITNGIRNTEMAAILRAVGDDVVLFHVHDNLGARRHDLGAPGVDPLRLDLHLAPGAGSLPWDTVVETLRAHSAPLMLEVEPSHRPELLSLATVTAQLLARGTRSARAAA
jgi:sugar phosphate isomerase/epimerase